MKLFNQDFNIQNLYMKQDPKTGLIAIIAIHNTKNGPALGGCRFVSYESIDGAISDAMKLAKAMTYKSAMAGLPLGGGKSVIISHPGIKDRKRMLESFGELVEKLNGEYITASDSGTSEDDMRVIAEKTSHVTSINKSNDRIDDTAFMTASGVVKAMEAALKFKFAANHLNGVHVAIQGIGSVGTLLAQMLIEKGARITISDTNVKLLKQRASELNVAVVNPSEISGIKCDVFSPCALGGIINESTIKSLQTSIICGAANNQLLDNEAGKQLHADKVIFVPDYVANAGGVICAAAQAGVITKEDSCEKMNAIYNSVMDVISRSINTNTPSYIVANQLAEERFTPL